VETGIQSFQYLANTLDSRLRGNDDFLRIHHSFKPGKQSKVEPAMKITKEEVEHVALLARLKFSEEEKERFVSQLNRILEYMDQLGKVDTSSVEATFHAVTQKNIFREDAVQPSLNLEETLANGPDPDRGFFRVPKIIE
jgi:aspartyl-tRNA(Asn)/glutamyl-tRNA(Gln) amidotransferase subunit C